MLHHRLRMLDEFLKPEARAISSYFATGELVLVDLTDPYLDGECGTAPHCQESRRKQLNWIQGSWLQLFSTLCSAHSRRGSAPRAKLLVSMALPIEILVYLTCRSAR